ncbi:30949_t:CDS:1 [Gigaspora margarita]|uniref:30949_t:CDS:1 n=1 Tax=Gigaspora margarita TaxID=4874 RepID=A0ABN7W2I5_GIGMA|nr:30949_t:CDS:1 [Gigaspora margarita]
MTFSGFTMLLKLNVSFNMITHIHYSLPSIQQIDSTHNLLSSTHLYSSSTLQKLNSSFNKITSYALGVPSLTHFDSSNNLLSVLSISSNILTELNCSNNPITLLPLNITSKLTSFDCMRILLYQLVPHLPILYKLVPHLPIFYQLVPQLPILVIALIWE